MDREAVVASAKVRRAPLNLGGRAIVAGGVVWLGWVVGGFVCVRVRNRCDCVCVCVGGAR